MKGRLAINIRLIRGLWHTECLIHRRWIIKTFDHYPTETEIRLAYGLS